MKMAPKKHTNWSRKTVGKGYKTNRSEQIYYVEDIIDKKSVNDKVYYLVKWKDYSADESTWESAEHLERYQCQQFIERFESENSNHSNSEINETKPTPCLALIDGRQAMSIVNAVRICDGRIAYVTRFADSDQLELVLSQKARLACPHLLIQFFESVIQRTSTGRPKSIA